MSLTDILLGVLIVGGAYYLYTRNSAVRDLLTLGHGDPIPPQKGIAVGEPNPSKPECNPLLPMLIAIKAGKCPSGYEPSCYGANGAGCCQVKEHVHCTNNGELIDDCNGKVVGHCDRSARMRISLS